MTIGNPNPNVPRLTTSVEIQQGFSRQLLAKWELITDRFSQPVIDFENSLNQIQAHDVADFISKVQGGLLDKCFTAIGASEKAKQHLPSQSSSIRSIISNALSGITHIQEAIRILVIGFSLISGDSLGGASRNIVGNLGEDIIQDVLILNFGGTTIATNASNRPKITSFQINNISYYAHWNKSIPAARKNYDFILSSSQPQLNQNDIIGVMEIKSGCDPAGADEHWSTAHSKLQVLNRCLPQINCGFASIIIDQTVQSSITDAIDSGVLVCGVNLNDPGEITRGIQSLL